MDALKASLDQGRKRPGTATTSGSPAGSSELLANAPAPAKKRNLGGGAVTSPQNASNETGTPVENTPIPDASAQGLYVQSPSAPGLPAQDAPAYGPNAGGLAAQHPAAQLTTQGPGAQVAFTQGTYSQHNTTEQSVAPNVVAESTPAEGTRALHPDEHWEDWVDWSALEQ